MGAQAMTDFTHGGTCEPDCGCVPRVSERTKAQMALSAELSAPTHGTDETIYCANCDNEAGRKTQSGTPLCYSCYDPYSWGVADRTPLREALADMRTAREAMFGLQDKLCAIIEQMLEYGCTDKSEGCGLCEIESAGKALVEEIRG